MIVTTRQILFWGPEDLLSNWHPSPMEMPLRPGGPPLSFANSEQAFMALKADHFADAAVLDAILAEPDPRKVKALGRRVKGLTDAVWLPAAPERMYQAVHAKFAGTPDRRRRLIDTGRRTIVEASPYDDLWGVKLSAADPAVGDPSRWRGSNWLGIVAEMVRDSCRSLEALMAEDREETHDPSAFFDSARFPPARSRGSRA